MKAWKLMLLIALVVLVGAGGCANSGQTGALIGGGAGAGIGQAIGRDTQSTLIGGGLGLALGYIFGNEQDKQREQEEMDARFGAAQETANMVIINITNSNGSITPVVLRRQGNVYIGPRGEQYMTLPTEGQLKPIYGF